MEGNSSMGNMMSMEGTMMMTMTFTNQLPFFLLLKSIEIRNNMELAIAGFIMFLLGVFYEFLKHYRLCLASMTTCPVSCCSCNEQHSDIKESKSNESIVRTKLVVKQPIRNGLPKIDDSRMDTEVRIKKEKQREDSSPIPHGTLVTIHLIETLVHGVQLLVSYVIMLSVMTYNVSIVICILAGCMVGYFTSNWPERGRRRKARRNDIMTRQTDCH
nr:uncharacterized protein LOC100175236 [Ciona intestinalis]|eukprot:XP_002122602.3 uncharacterized protein LOC100175236 [Ciona intestinalis]